MSSATVNLEWKNLNLCVRKSEFDYLKCKQHVEDKIILDNVSGHIESGHLVAILGASGAGKTTLLASISQRMRGPLTGEISINGQPINRKTMTKLSCFVPQFDITLDTLTPNEHLYFMGELKLDRRWSRSRKNERIEMLLQKMGLKDVVNTRISRLSGGERKRLNLAADLLTNPPIIFCDEPTTGLDSFNACTVIKALKYLTQSNRSVNDSSGSVFDPNVDSETNSLVQYNELETITTTLSNQSTTPKAVMCSIHQPTSEIFQCFSHIILMYAGRCVFQGTVAEAFNYFSSLGFECPINYNPADFYVKVLSDTAENEFEVQPFFKRPIDALRKSYDYKPAAIYYMDNFVVDEVQNHNALWLQQVWILIRRSLLHMKRNLWEISIDLLIYLIPYFAMALLYQKTTVRTQESVQDIEGALFIITCEVIFTMAYSVIHFYPSQMPILRRETNEHIYNFSAYYVAEVICNIPIGILRSFVGLALTYAMAGFHKGIWLYLQLSITLVITAFTANAYGLMMSGLFKSVIMEVSAVFDLIFLSMAGLYININAFPYMRYISLFFFSNEALSTLFWHDITEIECSPKFDGQCLKNGTEVLQRLSYNTNLSNILWDYIGLLILALIMHLFAFAGIRRIIRSVGYY